jgi:hypothetical protein
MKLFLFLVAAACVGFTGYLYFVPYRQAQSLVARRATEVGTERAAAAKASADRESAEAELAKCAAAAKDRAGAEARRKAALESIAGQLKPGLDPLGATIAGSGEGGALLVSFPAAKMIDSNGIDVADSGLAAIKILAGATKDAGAKARVKARSSAAPPPRELKSLFRTMGEVGAVRAARVMSALVDAGLEPDRVSIVGEGRGAAGAGRGRSQGRGRRAQPAHEADRVDIEIEPQ